jgi:hypothetical protein
MIWTREPPQMLRVTGGQQLTTAITGSYPRPLWYEVTGAAWSAPLRQGCVRNRCGRVQRRSPTACAPPLPSTLDLRTLDPRWSGRHSHPRSPPMASFRRAGREAWISRPPTLPVPPPITAAPGARAGGVPPVNRSPVRCRPRAVAEADRCAAGSNGRSRARRRLSAAWGVRDEQIPLDPLPPRPYAQAHQRGLPEPRAVWVSISRYCRAVHGGPSRSHSDVQSTRRQMPAGSIFIYRCDRPSVNSKTTLPVATGLKAVAGTASDPVVRPA